MSSNEEELNEGEPSYNALSQGSKKRRIQRACDICRRKKSDGMQMPDNRCSNCVTYSLPCTYVEVAKKRGPPKGYVESLENRVEKLEKLLRRLYPDKDILRELNGSLDILDPPDCTSLISFSPSGSGVNVQPRDIATSVLRKVSEDLSAEEEEAEDNAHLILADNLKGLSIDPAEYRFFGKSSGAMLIQTAIELKNEYTGADQNDLKRAILGSKRPEYWSVRPWERSSAQFERPVYTFPPDDLVASLIDLYFNNVNLFLPLLHRPTFERSIAEGLHYTDELFGATVLLVCAVASRYSYDRRVLLDGEESFHSSGWKWFEQVQMVRRSLLSPPSLYDLQFYCLSVQFLQGTSAPQACWTMVGIGIRHAQDVGAHRKKTHTKPWTTDDELWKRAFWVLVTMDRMISSALGRPCAIQDEDFDLDMPLEVDDEYWEHPDPEQRFRQPPDKPSLVTAFNLYLKLNQVLAFSLRTIYSINKSKILLGFVGQQWEQHIVAELDSALNKWVDTVPDFLRWDPNRDDDQFFQQSVALYSNYYHLQILIHRPFIPSPRKPSTSSFPSLAICTNAARSCSHIVDVQRKRGLIPPSLSQIAVFTAGIVLLLNIWGGKRSGLSTDPHKEMADVYKCMQVLQLCEQRWHSCGRLWDILYELASVGELPLPQSSPPATNKRERGSDSPSGGSPSGGITETPEAPRTIAGSKRVSQHFHQQQSEHPPSLRKDQATQRQHQVYELPVYSDELGRLPLHGQVNFTLNGQSSSASIGNMEPSSHHHASIPSNYWFVPAPPMHVHQQQYSQMHQHNGGREHLGELDNKSGITYDPMAAAVAAAMEFSHGQGTHPLVQGVSGSAAGMDPLSLGGPDLHMHHPAQMLMGSHPNSHHPPRSHPPEGLIDNDTIAMWSNAPTGFELDDWGTYLNSVSELTQGLHGHGGAAR
ncbi:hypothetical protein AMATHDRAFT_75846 [Amanita thiersii Skay4041]|uniref:Zn(2)-C6 fungal-type domain-containing protein n=1 Tax=Amanita thiersii Skay4041 TaxID=703135 RepID=A0A2A9NQJ1_9AGAR|nr:hypothetical protein AMATHDRAFT_75846 [Amanita thiersii Skay4041]